MLAPSSSLGAPLSLCLVLAGTLALPLALRAVNRLLPDEGVTPSYLPSVETPRAREPFDETAAADLREARPDFFVIGDSIAGTRIDPRHLSSTFCTGITRHIYISFYTTKHIYAEVSNTIALKF